MCHETCIMCHVTHDIFVLHRTAGECHLEIV